MMRNLKFIIEYECRELSPHGMSFSHTRRICYLCNIFGKECNLGCLRGGFTLQSKPC